MNINSIVLALCFFTWFQGLAQIEYPGINPGKAVLKFKKDQFVVENRSLQVTWVKQGAKIASGRFLDKEAGAGVSLERMQLFEIKLKSGKLLSSGDFEFSEIRRHKFPANEGALRYSDRVNGVGFSVKLVERTSGLNVQWEVALKDGSNYIRQTFTFNAEDAVPIDKITLLKLPLKRGASKYGEVDGSPIVVDNMFFAIEDPMAQYEKDTTSHSSYLPRLEPLAATNPFTASTVWGTTPQGQLRRGFLHYVERERTAPYRQNLHYNSWYDLSWIDRKLDEASCLGRIQMFGDSLILKRNVKMEAFLFDDGWDDNQTLWMFNKNFPAGFSAMAKKAAGFNTRLGVWISPWGGYMEDQRQRLEYGRRQSPPFETNANGFSLSGPVYFNRFKGVAQDFMEKYKVSLFKFDGIGAGNGADGASVTYQKDIEAMLKLTQGMRKVNPDLYLSMTVGTWPSVYWLNFGDVIWRAGLDTHTAGTGSGRQQWITYRDSETYKNVVKRAPLFPLNAVMLHGICIAENGPPGAFGFSSKEISDEIWSFFGTGTSLQELYINPNKLTTQNWDVLADAAKWARSNAHILQDVHWVGGDPIKNEVYGFAAWSSGKAVLTVRNPSGDKKTFIGEASKLFEIPLGNETSFNFYDAKVTDSKVVVGKGDTITLNLEPYEVRVIDAVLNEDKRQR
ncbi:hypothetical protein [Desertivirga xinjiangensis]|uniref:hypothetical protein n=1 Tax=Desertivirga xinjiangensis TaxID=539206 RepID=UPI00210AC4E4|nr:hypothetical protein [Pedobacter xinjiangensis]